MKQPSREQVNSNQIQQYLQKIASKVGGQLSKVNTRLQACEATIGNKLQNQKLSIAQKPKQSVSPARMQLGADQPSLQEIKLKKEQARQMLKRLDQEEAQLLRKRRKELRLNSSQVPTQSLLNASKSNVLKERSHYTAQQAQAISKLVQRSKQLQKSLADKNISLEKELLAQKILQMQKQQQEIENKRAQRRQQLLAKMEKAVPPATSRIIRVNSEANTSTSSRVGAAFSLKERTDYYYQKLERQAKRIEELQQKEALDQVKQINRAKKHLDLQEILDHEKRYLDRVKQVRSSSRKRLTSESTSSLPKLYPESYFAKLLAEQKQTEEATQRQQKERAYKFKQRIQEYSQVVQEQHRPHLDQAKSLELSRSFIPTLSKAALSRQESKALGQRYFDESKAIMKTPAQPTNSANEQETSPEQEPTSRKNDYLKLSKQSHTFSPDKHLSRVKELVNQNSNSEAVQQANKLYMDAGRNPERLAASIQAQLLVLSSIKN